jgi:hypothetical protein
MISTGQKTQKSKRLKKSDFKHRLFIESYGVEIRLVSNRAEAIEAARIILQKYLPDCFTETAETETAHQFRLVWNESEKDTLYKNGESVFTRVSREKSLEYVGSEIRRTIAEFAVGRVFIHAGVVGWKGKVILIPGMSFSGKTSLTAALVKRGAVYYSDEYAILDEDGFVYPFPKTLSIRRDGDRFTQTEYSVEALGGKAAAEKNRLGMVFISRYKPNASWKPQILTPAKGILEIIKHTVSIRTNPSYVLKVLTKAIENAGIVKSNRGDVSKFAGLILDFYEENYL